MVTPIPGIVYGDRYMRRVPQVWAARNLNTYGGTVAQQTVVQLIDDLSGGEADETVSFALDGVEYTIDLSQDNANKLRNALADYVAAARKAGGRKQRRAGTKATVKAGNKAQAQAIRDWARSQGRQISDRGRIPQELVVQFQEAHAS
jgi:hypothetical protein